MRPTSDELIVGIRNVLEDVLIPELQSDWAQAMGTQMALMLQHLEGRPDREPDFLAGENAKLEGVLAKANAALGDDAVAAPAAPAAPEDAGLEGLREHNEALRQAITDAIHAAYEQGEYGFHDLPADRLGITDDLMEIATRQAEFWQPIGFTYPGRQRR